MKTPRIAPVAEPLTGPLADHMTRLIPPGMAAPRLFLSVARNAGLFGFLVDSGLIGPTGLLDRRTLPADLRETVILRTCVAARNDYEFNLHVQTISGRMGLTEVQIDDLRHSAVTVELWRADQRAAIKLTDALVNTLAVPDGVYAEARQCFSEEILIEITQLVGLYTGVTMLVGLIQPAFDRYRPGSVLTTAPQAA